MRQHAIGDGALSAAGGSSATLMQRSVDLDALAGFLIPPGTPDRPSGLRTEHGLGRGDGRLVLAATTAAPAAAAIAASAACLRLLAGLAGLAALLTGLGWLLSALIAPSLLATALSGPAGLRARRRLAATLSLRLGCFLLLGG
ncbi:MAG: hypothetical protein WBA46_11270, partial [Thermomicrobiales bacterium]